MTPSSNPTNKGPSVGKVPPRRALSSCGERPASANTGIIIGEAPENIREAERGVEPRRIAAQAREAEPLFALVEAKA